MTRNLQRGNDEGVNAGAAWNARAHRARGPVGYFFGVYLNFWPPTLASAISPFFASVNTATPCEYFASFEAPSAAATALRPAVISKRFALNRSSASLFSKK